MVHKSILKINKLEFVKNKSIPVKKSVSYLDSPCLLFPIITIYPDMLY